MSWVRLDDGFALHPKVAAAGPLGMAMHVAAICYCNQYLTDGFVPDQIVPALLNLKGLAMHCWDNESFGGGQDAEPALIVEDLLAAGLWEKAETGYRIHDYLEYQPSKADVIAERQRWAKTQSRRRRVSAQESSESPPRLHEESSVPVPNPKESSNPIEGSEASALPPMPPKGKGK